MQSEGVVCNERTLSGTGSESTRTILQQRKAAKNVLSTKDQCCGVRGAAGAGKTPLQVEIRRGLDEAGAGREDLIEQVSLHLGHQPSERRHVCMYPFLARYNPAPLDDAGQLGVQGSAQGGHDFCHRGGVDRGGPL